MQEDRTTKDPFLAVEKGLTKRADIYIQTPNAVNQKAFSGLISSIVKLQPSDYELVFKAFRTNNGQFVYQSDIIETIKAHVSLKSNFKNK